MLKSRPTAAAPVRRVPAGELFSDESSRAQLSVLRGMNALERHRHFLQHCPHLSGRSAAPSTVARSDLDVVRDEHRFLWGGTSAGGQLTWEQRLARRYHDKLFKEYALADMSRHREGQVGLRWRTEAEVFDGKGQFVCGNKRCVESGGLASFELNFAYVEQGERRQALVKLRVCPQCERKLHYRQHKEAERAAKHERRRERKRERKERKAEGGGRPPKRRRQGAAGREARSDGGSGSSSGEGSGSGDEAVTPAAAAAATAVAAAAVAAATAAASELSAASAAGGDSGDVWLRGAVADKTQEEEMDDYFDLFCAPLLS